MSKVTDDPRGAGPIGGPNVFGVKFASGRGRGAAGPRPPGATFGRRDAGLAVMRCMPGATFAPRAAGTTRRQGVAAGIAVLLIAAAVLLSISCRSTAAPDPNGGLTVSLDAVPQLLKADSSAVSTIWATVLEKGHPVADSTLVSFVTTVGTITTEAPTRDGLAKATFDPNGQTGFAAVIAQVRAVRDTVNITVY